MKPLKQNYRQGEKLGTVEKVLSKNELITQKIIESLESNIIPWKKPWTSNSPMNLETRKEYRGINHFLLGMVPTAYPYFATFNQIKNLGGSVIKGSKSVPVFFYSPIQSKNSKVDNSSEESLENTELNATKGKSYWLMKQYAVFTMEQTENIDLKMFIDPVLDFTPVMNAEKLIGAFTQNQLISIKQAQNAAYSPSNDHIVMPLNTSFHSVDSYYSTIFHEMVHSTGHAKRLKRDGFDGSFHCFGSKGYAFEELIAELGAAMLASYCGVDTSLEDGQNAAYIKTWLKVLKDDSAMVYKAASKAQSAVDYILKCSGFDVFGESENENVNDSSNDSSNESLNQKAV